MVFDVGAHLFLLAPSCTSRSLRAVAVGVLGRLSTHHCANDPIVVVVDACVGKPLSKPTKARQKTAVPQPRRQG